MFDRLERFVVCIMKPLDGLVFLFVIINGMIGITIIANLLSSRLLMFAGCGVGLLIQSACVGILYRHNNRQKKDCASDQEHRVEGSDQWNRLPIKFIGSGAICIAFYGWSMLLSMYWPALHPFRGEVSVRCMAGLLLAVASGLTIVGIAGLGDPRICFAVHHSARQQPLPIWARVAGWMLLLSGFAAGGYLAFLITK